MNFSVIIPTYNRPRLLAECLDSFHHLRYPADQWELIVVNDGGHLPPNLPDGRFPNLRLITIPHAGPAAARNAGAKAARHPYLAFTDDDCRTSPDWLTHLATGFASTQADALAGRTLNPFPENKAAQAAQFLVDFLYTFLRDTAGNTLALVSNNAAYRRAAFEAIGGYDETFRMAAGEDLEIAHRLVAAGYLQLYYPAAQVWHCHRFTAWGHVRQQIRYGQGGNYFHRQQLRFFRQKQLKLADPTNFYIALYRAMRRSYLPLTAKLLLVAGQVGYRFGRFL